MKYLAKGEQRGNIVLAEGDNPQPGPRQVLVRTAVSLISRGSEIGGRYRKEEVVDARSMGYSAAGEIVATGDQVTALAVGQRVAVVAPHAEYVIGDLDAYGAGGVTAIPDGLPYEYATFHSLTVGAVLWTAIATVQPHETVVVFGQGLVGNLVLQEVIRRNPARVIAIDVVPSRLAAARDLGAHLAIDGQVDDAVSRVLEVTGGRGADLVMECVGGPAGVHTFPQAVRMTARGGRIHLISLYHEQSLPLDSSAIQGKTLMGGYVTNLAETWRPAADEAMHRLATGAIRVDRMITHRFAPAEARHAFDLLHDRPAEALGVLLEWT